METDRRGFVPVNEKMQVLDTKGKTVPHLYCIGDANGTPIPPSNHPCLQAEPVSPPAKLISSDTQSAHPSCMSWQP